MTGRRRRRLRGAVIGDHIGFALGHFGGRALVLRWGRYVRLTEGRLRQAEAFFHYHSTWIITVARFIEVLGQANGIVAGLTGLRWLRFLVFNALGAALRAGTWVSPSRPPASPPAWLMLHAALSGVFAVDRGEQPVDVAGAFLERHQHLVDRS